MTTKEKQNTTKEKQNGLSAAEARAVLAQETELKKAAFVEAYQALCNEYGCEILGSPALTHDGRLTCQLTVQVR